jgi:ribosomal protein L12E/L44/L45/RPP1/RPP2
METEIKVVEKPAKQDIVIPPLRNTLPLAINPAEVEITELARKQLESLNKTDRKKRSIEVTSSSEPRSTPSTTSDSEAVPNQSPVSTTEVSEYLIESSKPMHNLSSSIISKAELEDEIRKKVAKQDTPKKVFGSIEIPQELILSGLNTTPSPNSDTVAVQLHDQELIDILEGKSGDEMYEVITADGQTVLVKDVSEATDETTSYEIVTGDSSVSNAKARLLEREIAMRQIASLPVRKNKRPYIVAPTAAATSTATPRQSIAQSLAADWGDDDKEEEEEEMILEVVNMQDDRGEPQIKILNMTILNEAVDAKPKVLPTKSEPKILNRQAPKVAPKILNINASAAEPATFKRGRVIKKKEIWDPSTEKKTLPTLPPSITIKKLTKDSITKPAVASEEEVVQKPPAKKGKKRSEIDKLLQDEGAVNMIYSLERENNNEDVPEIEVKPDQKSLIDKTQEKSSLVTKAKAIKTAVLKQSSSPPETKPPGRGRVKREVTPVKTETTPTVVVTKAQKAPSTAGRKKKVSDNSWDYIYSQAQASCDDAMIIRRRSNSSYSSSAASPRRLSVDVNESLESPPPSAKKLKQDTFEFTKPPTKNTKSPADNVLNKDFVDELRGKISNVITKNKEKTTTPAAKGRKRAAPAAAETSATPAKRASERRSNGSDHKEYRLVKTGKVAHITLAQNPLSISLLSEMKSVLNQLESDDCDVVLITSSEGFSDGLDYSTLVQTTVDKRKQAASDLVTAFK